nr:sulfurtransferase TusA family protein [Marinicella sp. W31]MDC2875694.1 sulfurtransferase TusA family protein [Marinicella sp. W31]
MSPDDRAFEIYDLRGLKCPLPALKTEKRLAELAPGTVLGVATSDPLAVIDIPHLCSERGHRLIVTERTEEGHRFVIERG